MREKRFRIQVLFVVALLALVSWPKFKPIKEQATVWRANPLEVRTSAEALDRRFQYDEATRGTFAITDPNRPLTGESTLMKELLGRTLEGGGDSLRPRIDEEAEALEIVGRARTTMNEPVPYANLVLRNQVTGAVEARIRADEGGRFVFRNLAPGRYVIELIDRNGRVASAAPAVPSGQTNASGNVRVQQAQATLFVGSTDNVSVTFGSAATQGSSQEVLRTATGQDVTQVNTLDNAVSPRN